MSASLVGSEMCIRDRVGVRTGAPRGWAAQPPLHSSGHVVFSATGWRPDSVSYTHLTLPTICSV
eukprot:10001563-Alexandrium_andersonii.AAC.1